MMFKRVMFNIQQDFGLVLKDAVQLSMDDECNVLIQSECGSVFILIDIKAGTVRFRPDLVEAATRKISRNMTCDNCGHVDESTPTFNELPDDILLDIVGEIDKRCKTSPHFAKRLKRRQLDELAKSLPETAKLFQMLDDVFHGEHSRD